MRALTTALVVGLAGFLAVGCSSSPTTDGGTTTTGGTTGHETTGGTTTTTTTTTGGASATTSGGTTTAGTTTAGTTTSGTTGGTTGAAGSACTDGSGCDSTLCLGNVCCANSTCPSDTGCEATSCDGTGACVYPSGTSCGTPSCTNSTLTVSVCVAGGTCQAQTPTPCAGNLMCSDATSCFSQCTTGADCNSGFFCSGTSCAPVQSIGAACTSDSACQSGVCGVNGTGNCCTARCDTSDATCGATACDNTGACVFPDTAVACGASSCAAGVITASNCDGAGACVSNGGQACPGNLACADATHCNITCQMLGNAACVDNAFCDPGSVPMTCCPSVATGSTLTVDNGLGNDGNACCGFGRGNSCQTLTRAMQVVSGLNSLQPGTLITLAATAGRGSSDWGNETYPVSLGWGVTLSAPGVYFGDQNGSPEIFDIELQVGEAAGNPVTIGVPFVKPGDQVVIGSDSQGNLTNDAASINVGANQTLDILNASIYEAPRPSPCFIPPCGGNGITVLNSATLNIGFDQNGNNSILYLGGPLPNGGSINYLDLDGPATGILCLGTVTDNLFGSTPSLIARAQYLSIDAEDGCALSLFEDPVFGTTSTGTGWTNAGTGCFTSPPPDTSAILANGSNATVALYGATIQCMTGDGIDVTYSSNAGQAQPVVTISPDVNSGAASVIQNCSGAAVHANAGTVNVVGTTIRYNFIGVQAETDSNGNNPSIVLNDGTGNPQASNTTVICSSNQENGNANPGIDVYNNSAGAVQADYVNWDQWYDPNGASTATSTDVFYCDDTFTCTCQTLDSSSNPVCVTTAGSDDMDVVLGTVGGTPTGTVSSNNGASSASGCP